MKKTLTLMVSLVFFFSLAFTPVWAGGGQEQESKGQLIKGMLVMLSVAMLKAIKDSTNANKQPEFMFPIEIINQI